MNEHAGEGQQQLHQPDSKTFSLTMATALFAETQNLQQSYTPYSCEQKLVITFQPEKGTDKN
jgi:hypothetical protein